jgi:hypothetical protein
MPASIFDLVEAFFELLDFLTFWRFWVPLLIAAAVTLFVLEIVHEPLVRWILIVPIMLAGIVSGLVWHWKKD